MKQLHTQKSAARLDVIARTMTQIQIVDAVKEKREQIPVKNTAQLLSDNLHAAMMTEAELLEGVKQLRGIAMRSMREWPHCTPCDADYEIIDVDPDAGTITLGHPCTQARDIEGEYTPEGKRVKMVKKVTVHHVFTDEEKTLARKLKEAQE